ncbi:MAG: aminotransferase class V-fold PLP-dependent enzyme [Candidatus Eisenbacteria bacterium]|nr:aminotransferase class V-fold PLP-dependent enzyme [Candidatus Eisenbacteria bacterium]
MEPARFADLWTLDPEVTFLNHGSFGACPKPVLAEQQALRARLEREPVDFFARQADRLLAEARSALAEFVGAQPDDLALLPNTTHGVSTVLRSLPWEPGDELLTTDHEYNACLAALEFVAARSGARVVVAPLPFPIEDPEVAVAAILSRVTPRTRLALIDQITSPTALRLPIERVVAALRERGVETLVDGAHAPGMVPLQLDRLGAAYFTGNCHKWLCTPKGAAFLHVRRDRQAGIHPLAISHGANDPRTDRSRYRLEFEWTGTVDLSPYLCIPSAIRFLGGLLPGGWPALQAHNRDLARRGRDILAAALGVAAPCPDEMLGSMAALPLPPAPGTPPPALIATDPLTDRLFERFRIEVPVIAFPPGPHRLLRISAQIYNSPEQYERLGEVLRQEI